MFFDATRWSWPWRRSSPARAAGCEKAPDQPCCVSCDQNVGAHLVLDLGARVFAARSAFQAIEVYATRAFGHVLLIDGDLQLTARDEAYYHEMMVHVPLARSPRPAGAPVRVLVVGGGDGGCAREALRWPNVTVTLVDIDAAVLDAARRFFPRTAAGLDDPRTTVVVGDGAAYAAAAAARGERYDLVVCDSTDCSSRERASGTLYTDAFLLSVRALVGETGSFVRNYTSLLWNLDEAAATLPRYAAVFGNVAPYAWQQPTYSSGSYSALLCGAGAAAQTADAGAVAAELGDLALGDLAYWTPEVHAAAFALPAHVGRALFPRPRCPRATT